jgi:hypothetical protein
MHQGFAKSRGSILEHGWFTGIDLQEEMQCPFFILI